MKRGMRTAGAAVCLAVLAALVVPRALAAGEVAIDAANFPDPVFRAYVETLDTDNNGELSQAERDAVTRIDLRNKGLTSLQGIGFFPNLTQLLCNTNSLTELDVSGNPKLAGLFCNENQIGSLDLSHNPELTALHCYSNRITELDLSANPLLTELACGDDSLRVLDLRGNPELRQLSYLGGRLTTLDTSGNPKLEYLWCAVTSLENLDLSRNPALVTLGCDSNNLTVLDLTGNPALQYVELRNNRLVSVELGSAAPAQSSSRQQRPVTITLEPGADSFDMAALDPLFSAVHVRDLSGAHADGSVFSGLYPGDTVRYAYSWPTVTIDCELLVEGRNDWLDGPSMADWTEGQTPSEPVAVPGWGTPEFFYGASPGGPFSDQRPVTAGQWYLQVRVPAGNGYNGLETVVPFRILAAPAPTPTTTPVPSASPAATPSASPTAKPSAPPTQTPVPSPTATPSASPGATPSAPPAEPSASPARTPTPSPTAAPAATPGGQPSPGPSSGPATTPIPPQSAPQTGDGSLLAVWLLAGSLAVLGIAGYRRARHSR